MSIKFTEEQIYMIANAMYNATNSDLVSDDHYLDYIGNDETVSIILDLETKNPAGHEEFERKIRNFIDKFSDDFSLITGVAYKIDDDSSDYDEEIKEEGQALANDILNRIPDYFSDWI